MEERKGSLGEREKEDKGETQKEEMEKERVVSRRRRGETEKEVG